MNCPTCHTEISVAAHFCFRCGWPAGRLAVEIPGNTLGVPTTGEARVPLIIRNVGAGHVEYGVRVVGEPSWAFLTAPGVPRASAVQDRRLSPGAEDNGLLVGVDGPLLPPEIEHLTIEVHSSDLGGRDAAHFRPWNVSANRWRTWGVHIPIRRLGGAQVQVAQSLVIFTPRRRDARVTISNIGGAETTVSLRGLPGTIHGLWEEGPKPVEEDVLEVSFDEADETPVITGATAALPYTLPAESSVNLLLRAEDGFVGTAGFEVLGGGVQHSVALYAEPHEEASAMVKHWTVGIDFGTAKSAVFYTDNWVPVEARAPQPIRWPLGPDAAERQASTTRSAVMYTRGLRVPACGHHVVGSAGTEGENERIIESIKTRLHGDDADKPLDLWGDGAQAGAEAVTAVDVVAEFMQYLMDEVRSTGPFRGQVGMDSRLVLTLPVMEDAQAFRGQRDRTLRAAQMAGLAPEDLLTPTEPECAALDLMHCLRRGDYTFDGRTYFLQDGEVILVLDCGAGTTDVAVLRVRLSDGRFRSEHVSSAGYRFGGDTVDDILLSWLLDQQADQVRLGGTPDRRLIQPQGLQRPMLLQAARDECRRLKESIFAPGAPREPREFHTDLGVFTVAPGDVERFVIPFLEAMFTAGRMPDPAAFFPSLAPRLDDGWREALWRDWAKTARTEIKTIDRMLRETGLRRSEVTFLFVTGGTGQIPVIAPRLYRFMGQAARIVRASAEDCTVNVARGAALYYDYHLSGALPCDVAISAGGPEEAGGIREPVCGRGALPGVAVQRAFRIGPRQDLAVALAGDCSPRGPAGYLDSCVVANSLADYRQAVVSVSYGSDRCLRWGITFADGQVVLPERVVLQA